MKHFFFFASPSFRNIFQARIGDSLLFDPCGDSAYTTLVYTDSKKVFDQCIPESNHSSDIIYNRIGKAFDNKLCNWMITLHDKFERGGREEEKERKVPGKILANEEMYRNVDYENCLVLQVTASIQRVNWGCLSTRELLELTSLHLQWMEFSISWVITVSSFAFPDVYMISNGFLVYTLLTLHLQIQSVVMD